jgi:hypothetical protein
MIERIYDHLDLDQLERSARLALETYGRSIYFPFVSRAQTQHKFTSRAGILMRTCNLLSDAMAVPIPGRGQESTWVPIQNIEIQAYDGPVHSMSVDQYHHYIADGIVTHNCFYGWLEGAAHVFLGPNNATDLWHVKKVNPQSMVHLTEKPVELAVRAMQYSSREGEHVLDLFGGSGSTLIAAEQTGRKAFLMELDPLYADVIVQRYEKFTGRTSEVQRPPAATVS